MKIKLHNSVGTNYPVNDNKVYDFLVMIGEKGYTYSKRMIDGKVSNFSLQARGTEVFFQKGKKLLLVSTKDFESGRERTSLEDLIQ